MEYVGEVVDPKDFRRRAKEYSKDKNRHYYFMALKSDQIIDATMKGNVSRFINHSCDPNAETQKVNLMVASQGYVVYYVCFLIVYDCAAVDGEWRIENRILYKEVHSRRGRDYVQLSLSTIRVRKLMGYIRSIKIKIKGYLIIIATLYGNIRKEAQKCFCEAPNCCGWIGDTPEEEKEKIEKKEKREKDARKKKEEKKPMDYMEDEDVRYYVFINGSNEIRTNLRTYESFFSFFTVGRGNRQVVFGRFEKSRPYFNTEPFDGSKQRIETQKMPFAFDTKRRTTMQKIVLGLSWSSFDMELRYGHRQGGFRGGATISFGNIKNLEYTANTEQNYADGQ